MVCKIICLSMLVATVSAATWMGRLPMKPAEFADKEGCYIKEINDVVPFGDTVYPIGNCYRIECSRHMLYYASCGVVGTSDPKCYVTDYDLRRPYPECCPDVKCEVDNDISAFAF